MKYVNKELDTTEHTHTHTLKNKYRYKIYPKGKGQAALKGSFHSSGI